MLKKKKAETIGTVEAPEMVTTTTEGHNSVEVSTGPVEAETAWEIYDDAEQYVRTYSTEEHGDNAEDLAKMYIEGHPNCHIR